MKSLMYLVTHGIDYILQLTHNQPVKVYLMMPSCVPATNMETSGATILADDIGCYLHQYPDRIIGLGEMMNYPGVIAGDNVGTIKTFGCRR